MGAQVVARERLRSTGFWATLLCRPPVGRGGSSEIAWEVFSKQGAESDCARADDARIILDEAMILLVSIGGKEEAKPIKTCHD